MVYLKDVSKSYDGDVVLNKINASFPYREVIGLVGINGSGKSTLLKILAGEVKMDSGQVVSENEEIGYLPQFPDFEKMTILEFLIKKTHRKDLQQYEIQTVFNNLQILISDYNLLCSNLSGGEKTKLYIASLLLQNNEPTVLLLDEPTNNLDLEGLEWLEDFILNFQGSVVLTSHDRFFLDRVSTTIMELSEGSIKTYGGNYTFYKEQKQRELDAVIRQYVAQQKKIKQVREDIQEYKMRGLQGELTYTSRNPYQRKKARKAAQTSVVRQRKLEKFLESDQFIEKPVVRKKYGVSLKATVPSAKLVVEATNISKKFQDNPILKDVSFSIRGNDRLWISGKNGSGKSTLCRIITGVLSPDEGHVRFGNNIRWGYFSQNSDISTHITGLEFLRSLNSDTTRSFTLAAHLHIFEDDLRKKIKQMSPGQIAKLEFVRLLVQDIDLLILDEPTNHLEIETREDIENALKSYHGAILIVSHDRYFIDTLGVTHIFEL